VLDSAIVPLARRESRNAVSRRPGASSLLRTRCVRSNDAAADARYGERGARGRGSVVVFCTVVGTTVLYIFSSSAARQSDRVCLNFIFKSAICYDFTPPHSSAYTIISMSPHNNISLPQELLHSRRLGVPLPCRAWEWYLNRCC
jgi:hypothetical protein